MSLHPLHFFFTFLFYTDVGSTFFVLAAYLVLPFPDLTPGMSEGVRPGHAESVTASSRFPSRRGADILESCMLMLVDSCSLPALRAGDIP